MIVIILLLILAVITIILCCCAACTTPYDRQLDDEAQLEFLRKYRESKK